MPVPCADYTTFGELAAYAIKRVQVSCHRGGHQEAAYWLRIHQWAKDMHASPEACLSLCWREIEAIRNSPGWPHHLADVQEVADLYAQAVHCRKMLANRGETVPRLSLDWLREVAEAL